MVDDLVPRPGHRLFQPEHVLPDRVGRCRLFHGVIELWVPSRLVHWPRGRGVRELSDGFDDPVPGRRSVIVASECEFGSSSGSLLERLITVALEHQLRRPPNVDLGYHGTTPLGS